VRVHMCVNMLSLRKEREKRRKMEEMTRGEEVLINLSSVPFQFSFSSFSLSALRMDVLLRRRCIHAASALYFVSWETFHPQKAILAIY